MVGTLIRDRRRALGLSQSALARRLEMDQTYLSRLERGAVELPQRATLEKLGAALGITLPEFYRAAGVLEALDGGDAPPPPPSILTEDADGPYDPAVVVAYVEAKPGADFRRRLARQKARRTPESYTRLCLRLFRAWSSNADLALDAVEMVEQ